MAKPKLDPAALRDFLAAGHNRAWQAEQLAEVDVFQGPLTIDRAYRPVAESRHLGRRWIIPSGQSTACARGPVIGSARLPSFNQLPAPSRPPTPILAFSAKCPPPCPHALTAASSLTAAQRAVVQPRRTARQRPTSAAASRLDQARFPHMAAVAINYFAYNFIKIHTTLRTSPAMAAGVTDRLFDISDLVQVLIESEREKAA
jgi:hypothetical protein